MFLINWYREWLTLKAEFKQKHCESCDALNRHIERIYYENDRLTQALIDAGKPKEDAKPADPTVQVPIRPRSLTWPVRRQMLETNDRAAKKAMDNAPKPAETVAVSEETKELERELDVASETRESAHS